MNRPTDEQISEAKRVLRADYYQSVRDMAQDVIDEIKAKNLTDLDEAMEYVEQSVDGSHWVTYTHASIQCIEASDNYLEIGDQGMEAGFVYEDDTVRYDRIAYFALRADVLEQIRAEGVNLDDRSTYDDDEESEEDDESDGDLDASPTG